MAGVLHGSARTTPRVRAELQASQEATRVLAARHGLNPKTVQKWRKRTTTADQPMGPRRPRSTVLTEAEEAIVVEFRRRTLLPLDDVLGCLRESIPAALHGWLRHSLSGRDPQEGDDEDADNSFGRSRFGSRRAYVAPAQARCGPAPAAGGGPGDPLARTGRHGRDPERMAGHLRLRR